MQPKLRSSIVTSLIVGTFIVMANVFIGASSMSLRGGTGTTVEKKSTKRKSKGAFQKKHVNHCTDPRPSNSAANNCNLSVNKPFTVNCNLPFNGGQSREIDEHCPNAGCTNGSADIAQNKIKNNYCATGTAIEINFESIDRLQTAVNDMKLKYGPKKKTKSGSLTGGPPQPKDRNKIGSGKLLTVDKNGHKVKLGEGDLVSLDAFVIDAHHADTFPFGFAGETVNCKNSLLEWNDIHIALGRTVDMKECDSVTAEISPHFRPAVWERFDSNSCTVGHVENALPVERIRVRITGQLFFDASHRPSPCSNPQGSPRRRSVWEIHPVYRIEVFDVPSSSFISFEKWAAKQH